MTGGPDPPVARRPIRRLDPSVIERIAAGEVVERPASVVKELVENALDAGAREVEVRLDGGGLTRLEVSDDGFGIPSDELALAFERHATSKLDPLGPIDRIGSLGFRGEALAAIATVARVRLLSRPPGQPHATGREAANGVLGPSFDGGRAPGTTVEVSELFDRTPARRKFLKSPAAEQVEALRTVERLYLARPSVGVRVLVEGRELARYPTSPGLRDAAARVLGTEILSASFAVDAPVPGGRLAGVLGRPSVSAASSTRLFVAVNGRAIDARPIAQAVRLAFGEFLPRTRYPIGVLHLTIDPERLDVNVHPTKRSIRFVQERELADAVRHRVREALLDVPQVADRGERPLPTRPAAGPEPTGLSVRLGSGASGARGGVASQRTLEEGTGPRTQTPSVPAVGPHPALRLLGCLDAIYWVAEADDGLLLIDQHAASERVVFERLRRRVPVRRQALVLPVAVRLSGAQRSALAAHGELVRSAGFEVEPFGPEAVRVVAMPAFRGRSAGAAALSALLDELADGGRPTVPDGLIERTCATLACHAAIRAGDRVPAEEFARVLDALYALPEAAYACPHGRPIVVRIPRGRLDRWFLRSGV